MRVAVTGGTGFIGTYLVRALAARGDEVVVLTRDPARRPAPAAGARLASWDEAAAAVDGAGAAVNLAGETIAQRWTKRAKERIASSRTFALERLHAAFRAAAHPPHVLVSSSAVGYYGAHGDEPLTEDSEPGTDFLARTCVEWEEAARSLEALGARVARVRFGLVLSTDGGALPKMMIPFKLLLGGPVGSGRQYVSFVHVEDLVALLLFTLDHPAAQGALNGTAPEPVTMDHFAETLRRTLKRPTLVPAFLSRIGSALVLPLLLGEMGSTLLGGQRVLPERARELGFTFRFPRLETVLEGLLS